MPELRFTLLGEGTSDDSLLRIIQLLLEQPLFGLLPDVEIVPRFVSPRDFSDRLNLSDRIVTAAENFPCDVLFVHQDADGPTATVRVDGIRARVAVEQNRLPIVIPVVPVRAMESWLLLDETAICRAAGVSRRPGSLSLPGMHRIESIPDPKLALRRALERAVGGGARQRRTAQSIRPRDVARYIDDISPLRQLTAFRAFEADVRRVIEEHGWPERLPS